MDNRKTQILVLVEGEKTDVKLIQHLLTIYGINQNHEITSYNTNIYKSLSFVGYNETSDDDIPEGLTVLDAELTLLSQTGPISVLRTCVFYIWDYNPNLAILHLPEMFIVLFFPIVAIIIEESYHQDIS